MKIFDFFLKRRSLHQRIKLYSIYTPSHKILRDEWFLPTLQDDYEIILKFFDQECLSARYMDQGWTSTIIHKVELCIRAVQDNWNKMFLYSDVDIQFFKPTEKFLTKLMNGHDLMIQRDTPWGGACAGFIACKGNDKTLKLFRDIKSRIENDPSRSDQAYLNEILLNENKDMKWNYLPVEFFGGGTLAGTLWEPGLLLTLPENIFIHHANWTVGVPNKIAQLIYVRKMVEERKHSSRLRQKLS